MMSAPLQGMPKGLARLLVNQLAASHIVPKRLRRSIYRSYGMRIGSRSIEAGAFFSGYRFEIGQRSFVNANCFFESNAAPITIGDDCAIGMQVTILTSMHEIGPAEHRAGPPFNLPVTIEDGCWLGARVLVLPGVTIGAGCIVAAGAVVTRDCAPNGLYAGIPAERMKDLETA